MLNSEVNLKSLSAIVLLVLIPYVFFRRNQNQKADALFAKEHNCLPPVQLETKWPLGLDLLWAAYQHAQAARILRFFVKIVEGLPPTFEQRLLGISGIDTVDPRNIESVLATQFTTFGLGDRRAVFYPLLGDGIFTQDGESWKHSRELLRPLFLSKRVDNFLEIQDHVEGLVSCVPNGKVVDFQPLFFRFTLDTTTYLLFGRSIHSLGEQTAQAEAFAESFRIAQDFLAHRGRLGPLHWLLGGKSFRNANAIVHRFIDGEIQEALAAYKSKQTSTSKGVTNYGFLGALLQETQDPKVLRDQLLNVLLAGRDTTACCLTWTMRLLVKHQNVLSKLRDEIKSIVGVGDEAQNPDRNGMKKMIYLTYVLKEGTICQANITSSMQPSADHDYFTVLRLYPSVPINSRAAVKTTTLPTGGGPDGKSPILVKKGAPVGYCVYVMHRRKDLYGSDADEFRPERWDPNEDNEVSLKNIGWGYLPFNGGPRVCLGQEFALLEASYAIVRLVKTFATFEYDSAHILPDTGQERQQVTLVLTSADGCHIIAPE